MSARNALVGDADNASIGDLRFIEREAHRRTDRFIRLFHRAKEEAVRKRWLELAVSTDELAADATRRLRAALAKTRA